ncbi:MAG: Mannosyl-D-glycerate transport/metabolism system repressor MngR [Lentisphaerae bacterium ADurb.Bin242]|nr:MAG: Mannosyl-D-glycerate transport/metabolism system repressor MngR [Lentisphaerae bacterium ADurb.Bin242]
MKSYIAKSRSVADKLAEEISSGILSPGTKFSSIRTLATRFDVSQKVIMDAMDILESEKMVERYPRSGIFVKEKRQRTNILALILIPEKTNAYISSLLQILLPENRSPDIEFCCYTIDYYKRFAELDGIINKFKPDCILVCAPLYTERDLEFYKKLPFPVVFIGDFAKPERIHTSLFQVTGDNYSVGAAAAKQLIEETASRKAVYLCGENDYFFYRETMRGFCETATRLGIEYFACELPHGFRSAFPSEIKRRIDDMIRKSTFAGFGDCPIIDIGSSYAELFYRFGHGIQKRLYVMRQTHESETIFFRQIYCIIRHATANPLSPRTVVSISEYKLKSYPMEK